MCAGARPTLSICLTCRDGREGAHAEIRGGARLAAAVLAAAIRQRVAADLRGVRCMSQCKRPCVVSLTAPGGFTYVFGDLDPADPAHAQAVLNLVPLYRAALEGFLPREARPEPLRAGILARLPPIATTSGLTVPLHHPETST
ncbi:MAG: DUF1636 domain-containing protein [Gemmobacter sp.]